MDQCPFAIQILVHVEAKSISARFLYVVLLRVVSGHLFVYDPRTCFFSFFDNFHVSTYVFFLFFLTTSMYVVLRPNVLWPDIIFFLVPAGYLSVQPCNMVLRQISTVYAS